VRLLPVWQGAWRRSTGSTGQLRSDARGGRARNPLERLTGPRWCPAVLPASAQSSFAFLSDSHGGENDLGVDGETSCQLVQVGRPNDKRIA
jgi:hypothetical protein